MNDDTTTTTTTTATIVAAQGELRFYRVEALPDRDVLEPFEDRHDDGSTILGHSESGNHHVIDPEVEVLAAKHTPEGMRVLYAIVADPLGAEVRQTVDVGASGHETIRLGPGVYRVTVDREFDHLAQIARRVAD